MAPPCGSPLPCRILRRTSPEVQIPLINPERTASEIAAGLETLAILDDAPLRERIAAAIRQAVAEVRAEPRVTRLAGGTPYDFEEIAPARRAAVAWPRRRAHGVLVGPYSGTGYPL